MCENPEIHIHTSAEYADFAKYAEYLPIVFLVERPKILDL
jgi:hypothetical protein